MCEQCHGFHRLTGTHKLIDISIEMSVHGLHFTENICDSHSGKTLEIYCFDCSVTVVSA